VRVRLFRAHCELRKRLAAISEPANRRIGWRYLIPGFSRPGTG
jgi:hypothetical protein